jgi:uncharacterized membrane protein YphA (DoxX/SURF4 family)
MARIYLGRHVYGLAAVAFGIITFVWHDFNNWQQIQALGDVPHREILAYIAATIEIVGGVAIQWPRTARAGAFLLGCVYLIFALLWVPRIDRLRVVEPTRFGATCDVGSHRIHIFRSLRCFIHDGTTSLSFWNGILRPKMDSSGTNVLGDNDHDCAGTRGHLSTFPTFGASSVSLTYCDAHRLRVAGMAARAVRRST